MLYIGVDLGTSAVKLLMMDENGNIQKIVSKEYPLYFPHPGWSEQNPQDWFAQSMEGIKELTSESQVPNIWVAYEPVWSIGVNGTPASADYAEKMHKVIKACLREIFGDVADEIPVLYGGSVNPGNANELIVQPSIDGLFTGRAAWQADNFDKLIRDAKATYEAK